MYWIRFIQCFACLAIFFTHFSYAEIETDSKSFLPTQSTHANWLFSGVVTNERGEHFGYFFYMRRDEDQFHAVTALLDGENKRLLLFDEGDAIISNPKDFNWKVGGAFMNFNPINENWIFGLKTKTKAGFNFKVDMLRPLDSTPVRQDLRPGIELLVGQTSRLNGLLQADDEAKEQFVKAKNAWFRQVWLSEKQDKAHPISGVFCRFNDGGGFYSINMRESDAHQAAVTGSCDAQGRSVLMSQFIDVQEDEDGLWHIRISRPKLHLVLSNVIKQHSMMAGFIASGEKSGFCLLSRDALGGVV